MDLVQALKGNLAFKVLISNTLLQLAAQEDRVQIVEFLLGFQKKIGVDLNKANSNGYTPILMAADSGSTNSFYPKKRISWWKSGKRFYEPPRTAKKRSPCIHLRSGADFI